MGLRRKSKDRYQAHGMVCGKLSFFTTQLRKSMSFAASSRKERFTAPVVGSAPGYERMQSFEVIAKYEHGLNEQQSIHLPVAATSTRVERNQIAHYRRLRNRMHEGPLYTVLGDNVRVHKPRGSSGAGFDPFEGMPTYTQKYRRQRRKLPKLDTRPYSELSQDTTGSFIADFVEQSHEILPRRAAVAHRSHYNEEEEAATSEGQPADYDGADRETGGNRRRR